MRDKKARKDIGYPEDSGSLFSVDRRLQYLEGVVAQLLGKLDMETVSKMCDCGCCLHVEVQERRRGKNEEQTRTKKHHDRPL